jgi:hypothetical protein
VRFLLQRRRTRRERLLLIVRLLDLLERDYLAVYPDEKPITFSSDLPVISNFLTTFASVNGTQQEKDE